MVLRYEVHVTAGPPNKGMKLTKPGELRSFAAYPPCSTHLIGGRTGRVSRAWTRRPTEIWTGQAATPQLGVVAQRRVSQAAVGSVERPEFQSV